MDNRWIWSVGLAEDPHLVCCFVYLVDRDSASLDWQTLLSTFRCLSWQLMGHLQVDQAKDL